MWQAAGEFVEHPYGANDVLAHTHPLTKPGLVYPRFAEYDQAEPFRLPVPGPSPASERRPRFRVEKQEAHR